MKKRFIIQANHATAAQQDHITHLLKDNGLAYWHWFGNAWLAVSSGGLWSAVSLRDRITEAAGGCQFIVIEVAGASAWAAFGIPSCLDWFEGEWNRE